MYLSPRPDLKQKKGTTEAVPILHSDFLLLTSELLSALIRGNLQR